MLADGFYTIVRQEELPLGEFLAVIRLNPEHDIYKAQFPGYPITPGVCIVKVASEILSSFKVGAGLSCADNVKFLTPLSPDADEPIEFDFKPKGEDRYSITVKGKEFYSKMVLSFRTLPKDD